jgi:hypothetical protein
MSREQALKAANLIADDFKVGFCDSKMVELSADRIEEVYGNENAMSLRDLFATQALAGLLSEHYWSDHDDVSKIAYKITDAMLKARGKS